MPTDLQDHVQQVRAVNSHEHQHKEREWVENGPRDVLHDLLCGYEIGDLVSAGADAGLVQRLQGDGDIDRRWAEVEPFWQSMRFTGYGEAVRLQAKLLYGIDAISPAALKAALPRLDALRQPGQRLRLLREVANLDHIQTDDFVWACLPDESGPEFFFYDLSWYGLCGGRIDPAALQTETGVSVSNLRTLREAMEALFAKYAPLAIAVKSQHAYGRTLAWRERDDSDADRALRVVLREGDRSEEAARLCLGDWCWARGAELAGRYNLPFKIHTGYYAGTGYMLTERIPAGLLSPLLIRYPQTRFVLMHLAYPYSEEMVALVKHFPNAWADLCWAWSLDPRASMEFLRRALHAVPLNKVFAFGGDTRTPTKAVAYAAQARKWLTRALQAEVDEGELTQREAMEVAERWLRGNQLAVFDVESKRRAVKAALARRAAVEGRAKPQAAGALA